MKRRFCLERCSVEGVWFREVSREEGVMFREISGEEDV